MPRNGVVGDVTAVPGQGLHLLAGQMYFGADASSVRTLLGSCVGITLWHPGRRLGGMCHFLLPRRTAAAPDVLDGRYGEEAIAWLMRAVARAGTQPGDYLVGLYGGADTMPNQAGVKLNIGERNIELGWGLIEQHGLQLHEVDVGDRVPRNLTLDFATGQVALRRGALCSRDARATGLASWPTAQAGVERQP